MRIETIIGAANMPKMYANHSTDEELKELIAENLIGAQSRSDNFISVLTIDEFRYNLWSEHSNSQYWALKNDGVLGEQAADHLQRMVEGRRAAATDYLSKFFAQSKELATALDDRNGKTADLDQLMDNVAAGRSPSENRDGSTLPKSKIIEAFWLENEQALDELQSSYLTLQNYPKHLSEWLDTNNIDRPLEMDKLIEKHRYSGLNGQYEDAEALLKSRSNMFNFDGQHEFKPGTQIDYRYDALKGDRLQWQLELAVDSGNAHSIAMMVAVDMMHSHRRQALSEYTQQYQPLADTFNNGIATELKPRFTLQDLLDNLAEDDDAALMDDGSLHPQAGQIQAFTKAHRAALDALNEKQASLEAQPTNVMDWFKDDTNADRAYREVQSKYGIERWEQGELARGLGGRHNMFDKESFDNTDTFGIGGEQVSRSDWKKMLQERAHALENDLLEKLYAAQPNIFGDHLTLDQLIENFRTGRPLGTMPDGSLHPAADEIAQRFNGLGKQLADYIDSEWLRDGSFKPLAEPKETNEELVAELLALITESRRAWSTDELLSINAQQQLVTDDSLNTHQPPSGHDNPTDTSA